MFEGTRRRGRRHRLRRDLSREFSGRTSTTSQSTHDTKDRKANGDTKSPSSLSRSCDSVQRAHRSARANAVAVQRANRTSAWYNPRLEIDTGLMWAVGLTAFVVLTFMFFYYHHVFSDDLYVYIVLYWHMFAALIAILAFYFLSNAVARSYDAERTNSRDEVMSVVVDTMFHEYPLTLPLIKQMFWNDPNVQALPGVVQCHRQCTNQNQNQNQNQNENKEEKKEKEEEEEERRRETTANHIAYINTLMVRLVFSAINVIVRLQPVQNQGQWAEWRGWITHSPILREGWASQRPLVNIVTALGVDQNMFCDSRRPAPATWFRLVRNPVRFAIYAVVVLTIVFVIFYVWWAVFSGYLHGSVYEKTHLFVSVIEYFYLGVVLIALFYEKQNEVDNGDLDVQNDTVLFEIQHFIDNYPIALPTYKALYPCNPTIQALEIPTEGFDVEEARAFGIGVRHGFLIELQRVVVLSGDDLWEETARLWRQYFLDCDMRVTWRAVRSSWESNDQLYVDTDLVGKASCCVYEIPPEYAPFFFGK